MSKAKAHNQISFGAGLLGVVLVTALVTLAACAATPTQESTGGYIDDSAITAKVKAYLAQDPKVNVTEVHVRTYKGVVELSGFVDSQAQISEAGQVASQVAGVESVHNSLILKGKPATATSTEHQM